MEAEAAKLLGAGLAAVGAGLASLGVGNVFAKYLEGALRNPGAADGQQGDVGHQGKRGREPGMLPTASRAACSSASPLPNFSACWRSSSR